MQNDLISRREAVSKAELIIDEDGNMIECVRVRNIMDLPNVPDKNVGNMAAERQKAINEWLNIHCPKCANNDDRGTFFLNCQAECEVEKDVGIACIHYEKYVAESEVSE